MFDPICVLFLVCVDCVFVAFICLLMPVGSHISCFSVRVVPNVGCLESIFDIMVFVAMIFRKWMWFPNYVMHCTFNPLKSLKDRDE